jgi:hypothetical protein
MGLPVKADPDKVSALRAWMRGKRLRGIEPTADELWDRIKKTWPYVTQEQWEAIFQSVK